MLTSTPLREKAGRLRSLEINITPIGAPPITGQYVHQLNGIKASDMIPVVAESLGQVDLK